MAQRLNKRRNKLKADPPLSAYRLMWVLVMFDLPVDTDVNRKAANDLGMPWLNFAFSAAQFT